MRDARSLEGADVTRVSTEGMRRHVHVFTEAAPEKHSIEVERREHVCVVDCRCVKNGVGVHQDVVGDVALLVFVTNTLLFLAAHGEGTRITGARCSHVGVGSVDSSIRIPQRKAHRSIRKNVRVFALGLSKAWGWEKHGGVVGAAVLYGSAEFRRCHAVIYTAVPITKKKYFPVVEKVGVKVVRVCSGEQEIKQSEEPSGGGGGGAAQEEGAARRAMVSAGQTTRMQLKGGE